MAQTAQKLGKVTLYEFNPGLHEQSVVSVGGMVLGGSSPVSISVSWFSTGGAVMGGHSLVAYVADYDISFVPTVVYKTFTMTETTKHFTMTEV